MSPAHVSKIERGLASPSLLVLTRIVQALDLHDADLFGLESRRRGRAGGPRRGRDRDPERSSRRTTVSLAAGIAIVLAGTAEAHVSDELFALYAGDTLIVPPLAPHAIRNTGGASTRTVYIASTTATCDAPTRVPVARFPVSAQPPAARSGCRG